MSADLVLGTVHALAEHGPLPIGRLAELLRCPVAALRAQLAAFNDVEIPGLVMDPMFTISPVDGWPDEGPDPDPDDADVVAFSTAGTGGDLGLAHLDAGTLGPLLAAAEQLRTLEPGNLVLASAVDTLRTELIAGVSGNAAYRTRMAAVFQHAATSQRAVRITYSNAWTPRVVTRVVHPYRVVSTRRGYEVDAGPLDADGRPRTYLLTGVRDFHVLEDVFPVPGAAAEAIAANRRLTAVHGVAPHRAMWAVRHWAERVDQDRSDAQDVAFTAWLLPPVAERVALICLAAGPGVDLDDAGLGAAVARRASVLLRHHGL